MSTIAESHTHYADGRTSRSVIEVNTTYTGTIRLVPLLGDNDGLATLTSCELTGAASVSGTSLTVEPDNAGCYATVTVSVAGTYTVTWTFTTADSSAEVVTGTLIAH